MASKVLIDYIKKATSKGFSESEIRDYILQHGYSNEETDEAFSAIKSGGRSVPQKKKAVKAVKAKVKKIVKVKKVIAPKKKIVKAKKVVHHSSHVVAKKVAFKKPVKKVKKVKKKVSPGISPLYAALHDLDGEIAILNRDKQFLKNSINHLSSGISGSKRMEESLNKRIAKLAKREADLIKERKVMEDRLSVVNSKMNKIAKIESEMKSI